jgi:hypothetical protein
LVALGLAIAVLGRFFTFERTDSRDVVLTPASFRQRLDLARKHVNAGSFRLAADEMVKLHIVWQAQPGLTSSQESQEMLQLEQEAQALADLSGNSLEEILDRAASIGEAEWLADFSHRFEGEAILFDLEVRGVGGKHFEHAYLLWARGEPAVLDLDDLELLAKKLPLQPPRTIFLARLASVRREAQRGWVIRLQPNSGVLLTEPGAARMCCPALAGAEVEALLQGQRAWAQRGP